MAHRSALCVCYSGFPSIGLNRSAFITRPKNIDGFVLLPANLVCPAFETRPQTLTCFDLVSAASAFLV